MRGRLAPVLLAAVSWTALAFTLLPSILFLAGRLTLAETQTWMLFATLAWFAAAPGWMRR